MVDLKNNYDENAELILSAEEIESLILDYGSSCCLLGAYEIIGINDERIENRKDKTEKYQKKLINVIKNLKSSQSPLIKNDGMKFKIRG